MPNSNEQCRTNNIVVPLKSELLHQHNARNGSQVSFQPLIAAQKFNLISVLKLPFSLKLTETCMIKGTESKQYNLLKIQVLFLAWRRLSESHWDTEDGNTPCRATFSPSQICLVWQDMWPSIQDDTRTHKCVLMSSCCSVHKERTHLLSFRANNHVTHLQKRMIWVTGGQPLPEKRPKYREIADDFKVAWRWRNSHLFLFCPAQMRHLRLLFLLEVLFWLVLHLGQEHFDVMVVE